MAPGALQDIFHGLANTDTIAQIQNTAFEPLHLQIRDIPGGACGGENPKTTRAQTLRHAKSNATGTTGDEYAFFHDFLCAGVGLLVSPDSGNLSVFTPLGGIKVCLVLTAKPSRSRNRSWQ
jgi:hypothetical protein